MVKISQPPIPPGFVKTFNAGGWRAIEREYHARTETLLRWHRAAFGEPGTQPVG